jgi:hypothetical protein
LEVHIYPQSTLAYISIIFGFWFICLTFD